MRQRLRAPAIFLGVALEVPSPAFGAGGTIPKKYADEGEDVSPPLEQTGLPDETEKIALLCEELGARMPEPFVHWVLYDPSGSYWIAPRHGKGALEGENDFGSMGYDAPVPPKAHGTHHYHFRVYVLDEEWVRPRV